MRTVIVGPPRCGKSTLAASLGAPVYCADPPEHAEEQRPGVTYMPNGIPFAAERGAPGTAPDWIAKNWLTLPGPWTMEGVTMARALRRWMEGPGGYPCDRVIVLVEPKVEQTRGQANMGLGIMSVWITIEPYYRAIARYQ